ncbi:MAG: hypothetical protein LBO79_11490 [Zoogloeaceae bacterium]|nr:hypothetical protein [Zoogloeaceae bacterium]
MRKILCAGILAFSSLTAFAQQEPACGQEALAAQLTRIQREKELGVIWLPNAGLQALITPEAIANTNAQAFFTALDRYVMLGVLDISGTHSRAELVEGLSLRIAGSETTLTPLDPSTLDPIVQQLFRKILAPGLEKGIEIVFFLNRDENGQPFLGQETKAFTVTLGEDSFTWTLPIACLASVPNTHETR